MKRLYIPLLFTLFTLPLFAQQGAPAAPAKASVFEVFTYRADGSLLSRGNGFFVQPAGHGVAAYSLFENATRAEIVDSNGRKYAVTRIAGASSRDDLVTFITAAPSPAALSLATKPAENGWRLALPTYGKQSVTRVSSVSPYNDYVYYALSADNVAANFGCPLLCDDGSVVGIVQKNVETGAKTACALDARLLRELSVTSVSGLKSDLRNIRIPKTLPATEQDALAYIYVLTDSTELPAALNDFCVAWPQNAEGYVNRATYRAGQKQLAACDADFQTAFALAGNAASTMSSDAAHFRYGRLLYSLALETPSDTLHGLRRALAEADTAYALNPLPAYRELRGQCLYALRDYRAALAAYDEVNRSSLASPDSWLAAAQCEEQLGADSLRIMQQLDSCLALVPRPYTQRTAPYLYLHALQATKVGRLRDAVTDYNEYEKAIGPKNLTAQFYYLRAQLQRQARMYQQALDDLRTAQARSAKPDYYVYRLEECALLVQVGLYDETIQNATDLLRDLPETPDLYRFIGIAYGEKGDRTRALENLNRAAALGDTTASQVAEKYK